jgi:hypothetical protein
MAIVIYLDAREPLTRFGNYIAIYEQNFMTDSFRAHDPINPISCRTPVFVTPQNAMQR